MQKSNFLMIKLMIDEFKLYVDSYSDEKLHELREKYDASYAFFRHRINGTSKIVIFPVSKTEHIINTEEEYIVDFQKDPLLIKKLVHELLFRKIIALGRDVEKYSSIRFMSNKEKDNLLNAIIPDKYKGMIAYKKQFEIDSRVFFPKNQAIIGILINSKYRWDIKLNCLTLKDNNINLINKYVCEMEPSNFRLLAERRKLLGKIASIDNNIAVIRGRNGKITRPLSNLFLENNFSNRNEVLSDLLGERTFNSIINKIKSSSGVLNSAEEQIKTVEIIADWLKKTKFTNEQGFEFQFTELFNDSNPLWHKLLTKNTRFIFSIHEDKIDIHADKGLKNYGPYDSISFTPKTPKIAVILNKENRGIVTSFLNKLENGIPFVKTSYGQPYGQGMIKKYELSSIEWVLYETEGNTIADYSKAIKTCLSENSQIDLALVQTSINHKGLKNSESPYYLAKAKFMMNNIPVQEVNIETMKKADAQIVYILNNIALACYAKLGGTPWVIPSNKSIDRELVIGIGSTIIKKDRFKYDKRIVGLTTVFNSDGRYILSNKSREVEFDEYFDTLLSSLKLVMNEVSEHEGWTKGDNVRLIFHCFKPFKNKEAQAIKKVVDDLNKEYNVLYSFIHVANYHSFFIVDTNNQGNYGKGKWMLSKGSGIILDKYNSLIQLTGAQDIKTPNHGMARPILIKLHKESTFIDLQYLSQQLLNFTGMSFRSFSTAPLPVTIWYSQMIAKLLGNMKDIEGWDSDNMINKLKYSRWFL
ncbi:MAG: hypothetical protein GX078_08515 [Clostridiales bacterium]|nr:hypothetical protein [Clostridiales bacterium]